MGHEREGGERPWQSVGCRCCWCPANKIGQARWPRDACESVPLLPSFMLHECRRRRGRRNGGNRG